VQVYYCCITEYGFSIRLKNPSCVIRNLQIMVTINPDWLISQDQKVFQMPEEQFVWPFNSHYEDTSPAIQNCEAIERVLPYLSYARYVPASMLLPGLQLYSLLLVYTADTAYPLYTSLGMLSALQYQPGPYHYPPSNWSLFTFTGFSLTSLKPLSLVAVSGNFLIDGFTAYSYIVLAWVVFFTGVFVWKAS
jgi:hypothetical protein